MTEKIYLGFDPGRKGGIASIRVTSDGTVDSKTWKMPSTEEELWGWFSFHRGKGPVSPLSFPTILYFSQNVFACLEKVGGYIAETDDGEGGIQPGSYMFNFGKSYGMLLMAIVASGIPKERRIEVVPKVWQRGIGIPPRNRAGIRRGLPLKPESKREYKNRLKERAISLFPKANITLQTCDAMLIAEYARRRFENATDEGARETIDRVTGKSLRGKNLPVIRDGEITTLLERVSNAKDSRKTGEEE